MRKMLYEAVYWRAHPNKPPFEKGLASPGVNNALENWGEKEGDTGVIALVDSNPAGAAWYRYYKENNAIRGFIDETIPVIVIAVHNDYRRQGIGEKLLAGLLLLSWHTSQVEI